MKEGRILRFRLDNRTRAPKRTWYIYHECECECVHIFTDIIIIRIYCMHVSLNVCMRIYIEAYVTLVGASLTGRQLVDVVELEVFERDILERYPREIRVHTSIAHTYIITNYYYYTRTALVNAPQDSKVAD
jgi:hypothetical protein